MGYCSRNTLFLMFVLLVILAGCASQDVQNEVQKKYQNVTSLKILYNSTVYSNTFKICGSEKHDNSCKEKEYKNFEDLNKISTSFIKDIEKSPDKYVRIEKKEYYTINPLQMMPSTFFMCLDSNEYDWSSTNSTILIKREEDPFFSDCKGLTKTALEFNGPNALIGRMINWSSRIRTTTLEGKKVIEFYEINISADSELENWYYFDATSYTPIKAVETRKIIYDAYINGIKTTYMELQKEIVEHNSFEVNAVSDTEFVLPEELRNISDVRPY